MRAIDEATSEGLATNRGGRRLRRRAPLLPLIVAVVVAGVTAACGNGTVGAGSPPAAGGGTPHVQAAGGGSHGGGTTTPSTTPTTVAPTTVPPTTVPPTTVPPTTVPAGVPTCDASQLSGTFQVAVGSAGAGHVVYVLSLRNNSSTTCSVAGLPEMQLVSSSGQDLPTNVQADGSQPATEVDLGPGASAYSAAWFSPDVPGVGEPTDGYQCEQTAYTVAVGVTGGSGTVSVPVESPTPVCEHGSLPMTALSGTYPPNA